MPVGAITFDFHNTLVRCDPWFELEVRSLPGAFAAWRMANGSTSHATLDTAELDASYRRLRRSIIEHGHELTAERSLAVVFGRAGHQLDDDELSRGVSELMHATLEHASDLEGARETLAILHARGVPLGVVSSAVYHPFLEWTLERLGMREYFDVVVTSASCGYYKSRPEIYWETLAALGASPERSLHIGDSARFDVGGAAQAGMRTAYLTSEGLRDESVAPDLVLDTLIGAAPLLLELYDVLQQP